MLKLHPFWEWSTKKKKLTNHRCLSLIQGVSQDPEEPNHHMWVPPASHPQPCRYSSTLLCLFSKSWNTFKPVSSCAPLSFRHRQISTSSRLTRSLSRYFGWASAPSMFRIPPLVLRGQFNCKGKGEALFCLSVKHEGTKYVTPSALFQS